MLEGQTLYHDKTYLRKKSVSTESVFKPTLPSAQSQRRTALSKLNETDIQLCTQAEGCT
jgi:hypothetical protein